MKASELMIGDLCVVNKDVCLKKGTIVKVLGVDSENTLKQRGLVGSVSCIGVTDPYEMSYGVWCEYLNPIPLTAEILEKNGFVKQNFDGWEYIHLNDCTFSYVDLWRTDYDNHLFINKFIKNYKGSNASATLQISGINYVHELQHALRLCEIEKEMIL